MSAPVESAQPVGLLLCDDLIFTSRISGTARDLGLKVRPARSMDVLLAQARQQPPRCIILDLGNASLNLGELTSQLRSLGPLPRLVAYGSHVDADSLRKAREAGCDPVLPRSKFVEELPTSLVQWFDHSHQ
jgi:CheY-like chemotaxis protein